MEFREWWAVGRRGGRGGGRGRGRSGGRGRSMGWTKLRDLVDDDNLENITLELTSDRSGFESLLNSYSLSHDIMDLVLVVIYKACSSQHKEGVRNVLQNLCTSGFLETHLVSFIKQLNSLRKVEHITPTVLKIFDHITRSVPRYSETCHQALQWLKIAFQQYHLAHRQPELEEEIDQLEAIIEEARYRRQCGLAIEDEEPPDNYRDLQMFPSPGDEEWLQKPFLRKNKDQGAYSDLDTYLDVQFRLLREDYIQPLRKGIQKYKTFGRGKLPNQLLDMWLYHDVHVICSVCNEDVDTRIKFDVSRVGRIRWQSTKRLIFGSLVCLSKDGFKTMLFASVTNRATRDLLKGIIEVRFEKDFEAVLNITPTDTFIMAETPAYFEAYRHVLKQLQEIQDDLPFQNYIVDCDTSVQPPAYLCGFNMKYSMCSLGDPRYVNYLSSVPVLNIGRWPCLDVYKLNEVQLDAVKTALTKEIAIIQGPPGTGKTYVGLKIMEVLLANKDKWPCDGSNNVILVVCYTNHALDQFLEGILKFHQDGVIRVGGRSNSDQLKPFNLKELRYSRRKTRQRKRSVYENNLDCKKKMSQLKTEIEAVGCKLEASMLGILQEETLHQYMVPGHFSSLTQGYRITRYSKILSWLEFKHPTKPSESDRRQQTLVDDWTKAILSFVNREGQDETTDSEDVQIQGMDLVQRVRFYKTWLSQFRENIQTEVSKIEASITETDIPGRRNIPPLLQKLKSKLLMSKNAIVPDEYLRQFVPRKVYHFITTHEMYSRSHEGYSIKVWLGASPFLVPDSLIASLRELEDEIELSSRTDEEADIITSQRIVDDTERIFDRKPGRAAALLSRAMGDLADNFQDVDELHLGWQSAEQQVYHEHRKEQKKRLNKILMGSPTMSDIYAQITRDVWELSIAQRESLYRSWVKKYQLDLKSSIQDKEREYRQVAKRLKEVLQEEDRDILAEADVIGMTTTGAAKHAAVLQTVAPRIIVVEEAAEVLEAHIIATLNPKCQHLILIGDHQQLRPNPTVYELAKKYNLDVSLFERLVKNQLHHVTLEYQHRMRPEISVIMKHIYPKLKDHDSVTKFENVFGVDSNVFFISHEKEESHISESKSKSNEHEASFILALCRYFLQQGYESSDITILAAYTGQISLIKRLMGNDKDLFQDVRITSVDNFQGEECKIILLSFVRSNEAGSVGFLSTDNRVCVALSRAKVGMFAIGNFKLLAQKSPLWAKIVHTLECTSSIGQHLLLRCRNHPDVTVSASTASDFDQAPKGGCKKVCGFTLRCGHICEKICHLADMEHSNHRCQKPCRRVLKPCGHRCLKRCFEKCHPCTAVVTKTVPSCKHDIMIRCSLEPKRCITLCKKPLSCGHLCKSKCAECTETGHHGRCVEKVEKQLNCGHIISKYCFASLPKCTKPCSIRLPCGHTCTNICGDCPDTGHVEICQENIKKVFQCEHVYRIPCHRSKSQLQCPGLCRKALNCGHICKAKCRDCEESVHKQCKETVDIRLKCGHVHSRPCYRRKESHICMQQCNGKLDCGHTCNGCCYVCFGSTHKLCEEIVKVLLRCGHTHPMKCCNSKRSYLRVCSKQCDKTLNCGHKCKGECSDCFGFSHRLCDEMVPVTLPCGHTYQVKCCKSKGSYICSDHVQCGAILTCGHSCKGKCRDCSKSTHMPCDEKVVKRFKCGHAYRVKCCRSMMLCPACT